jgi:voltage-gated potassium channel
VLFGGFHPATCIGGFLAAMISLMGIAFFGMPAGTMSAGFVEEIRLKRQKHICPHCGKEIE